MILKLGLKVFQNDANIRVGNYTGRLMVNKKLFTIVDRHHSKAYTNASYYNVLYSNSLA